MAQRYLPGAGVVDESGTASQRYIAGAGVYDEAASGPATHTTTGVLSAGAATIAGTAAHSALHATTGALSAQAASLSGTAAHATLHATSGALSAQAAAVSGAAAHSALHATSGALAAQEATLAGTAAHSAAAGAHAASGALTASEATIAGTASHVGAHAASGALAAQVATLAGSAGHVTIHAASGALAAGEAIIVGAGIGGAVQPPIGGGGFVRSSRRARYDYLNQPTRERLAELARAQREAMGILPAPARKPVEAAAKKEARRAAPSITALAPVVAKVAHETGAPARDLVNAAEIAFYAERALVEARLAADLAMQAERQREADARAHQQREQHMRRLISDDDAILESSGRARDQAAAVLLHLLEAQRRALLSLAGR